MNNIIYVNYHDVRLRKFTEDVLAEVQRAEKKFPDTYGVMCALTEEVGELAKAIRKTQGLYQEKARQKHLELEEEFADVLSYLLDLANYFQVDLETAFREKEQINANRTWE